MPAAYAHSRFGEEVRKILPPDIKTVVNRYPEIFKIGLQGPDILFYYHPSDRQFYVLYGHGIHRKPASVFLDQAIKRLGQMKEPEKTKGMVYLMGFLCHFILDSRCHPTVRENTIVGMATHREIERELDRFLMIKDGLQPKWYFHGTKIIPCVEKEAEVIASFYPEANAKVIKRSIENMRIYETLTTMFRMRKPSGLEGISREIHEIMDGQMEEGVKILRNFREIAQVCLDVGVQTVDKLCQDKIENFMKGMDRNFG